MIKITSTRWRAIIGSFIIMASFVISSISGVLINSSTASAYYTYTDTTLTTKDDCEAAAGGTWTETDTSPRTSYCVRTSSPDQDAKVLMSAGWLSDCLAATSDNVYTGGDIASNNIHAGAMVKNKIIGHIISTADGKMDCNNVSNVQTQLSNLRYTNLLDFLIDAGCTKQSSNDGSYYCGIDNEDVYYNNIIAKRHYGMSTLALSKPDMYYFALNTFTIGCKAARITSPTIADENAATDPGSKIFNITEVDSSGLKTATIYSATYDPGWGGTTKGANISTIPESVGWESDGQFSCQSLADMTGKYADDYSVWAIANSALAKKVPDNTPSVGAAKQTCGSSIPGIGWIICPITTAITALNDGMWNLVSGMLNVNPIAQTDSNGVATPIYTAWGAIRSIANVLFVIFFLVIIFSQISNYGIDNYGIKKILPRLIVCAILVNVSFVIVQLAVDLANIAGSSLFGLITSFAPQITFSWVEFATNVFSGTLVASGAVGTAVGLAVTPTLASAIFYMILPMALMGLLGFLAAILTLIFRQAVIPILAIIAPLAFVAYLLPNTEKFFKQWKDMLIKMLMMYPIAATIFGGSLFAASVIIEGNKDDAIKYMTGLIVMSVPLFAIPFISRQGGALLNAVGGQLSKLAEKARNPITDWSKVRSGAHMADYLRDKDNKGDQQRFRGAPRRFLRAASERRKKLETQTKSDKDALEAQGIDGQIKGTFGRTVSSREARKDAFDTSKNLTASQAFAENEARDRDARVNGAHGRTDSFNPNQSANTREYKSQEEKKASEALNTNRRMDDQSLNPLRARVATAVGDSETATNRANTITEGSTGILQVRASTTSSAGKLEIAKEHNKKLVTEASTLQASPEAIAGIDAATQGELQINAAEQKIESSGTAAATRIQDQEYRDILIADGPGGPGTISDAALRAGGIDARIDPATGLPITDARGATRGATRTIARAQFDADKADSEEVSALSISLADGVPSSELRGESARQFATYRTAGDSVGMRAAVKNILTTGGGGKERLGREIEAIPAGDTTESTRDLKSALLTAGIKTNDIAQATWAIDRGNRNLNDVRADPTTYDGLSTDILCQQTEDSMLAAAHIGVISPAMATETLENEMTNSQLDTPKRAILEAIRNGTPIPPHST